MSPVSRSVPLSSAPPIAINFPFGTGIWYLKLTHGATETRGFTVIIYNKPLNPRSTVQLRIAVPPWFANKNNGNTIKELCEKCKYENVITAANA